MSPTNLSELALEVAIVASMTGISPEEVRTLQQDREEREAVASYNVDWVLGDPRDYDREHVLDTHQLLHFLETTQPEIVEQLGIGSAGLSRTRFLDRLQSEVVKRGVIDVLRKGIKHHPVGQVDLFYGLPTEGNPTAQQHFRDNVFSVTRQLQYSPDETRRALDIVLFINGLPLITMELKNAITNQDYKDAIRQYQRDRSPKEKLFQFGVCAVHLAVDDDQVWFTTRLSGTKTHFLPFNKGHHDGAGNPPNPNGIKTDYLWKQVLGRESLADLIENYIVKVEERADNGKRTHKLIFPRYHQLDVVRKLLIDVQQHGIGRKYLIQHSAGSGKSNSIAWLANQLIEEVRDGQAIFDTVLIVTDRKALDKQLSDTVVGVSNRAGAPSVASRENRRSWTTKRAESSAELAQLIRKGQRIILTTVQKFPFIADTIGTEHRDRSFAIIIDEAHSSQGGRAAGKLNATLARELDIDLNEEEELSFEDQLLIAMKERKMLTNASYFAFTATPKNRTLEMFGERSIDADGQPVFRPFHTYSMKQAIDEGFILDVLQSYTPYRSFYRLMKTVEDDPEYDRKRAQKKLRRYVESHPETVRQKADIIVDHFHTNVIAKGKVGGQARAMVVTGSIDRAIDYWKAITAGLAERRSPYKAIIAFSGERMVDGQKATEATLNGFPSKDIPDRFEEHPYRFLVVADKFQTGFDEPLLHTMYVDKELSSVKAVQTLSRLNRAHPAKQDTFIRDFHNEPEDIERAFQPFYRTTLLSGETNPDKLHDLQRALDEAGVYTWEQVRDFVERYLDDAPLEQLHPILDHSRAVYESDRLADDERIEFKSAAKAFVRTYSFLGSILPHTDVEWEELSIFLRFLIPKLPAPDDPDLAKGILESIDMESYRVQARKTITIELEDEYDPLSPTPTGEGGPPPEPELDRLSSILKSFNDLFAEAGFSDEDRVTAMRNIEGPIMGALVADSILESSMRNSSEENTRDTFHDRFQQAMVRNVNNMSTVYAKQQREPTFGQQLEAMVWALYRERIGGPPS